AWLWRLRAEWPGGIHVTASGRSASVPGVRVHRSAHIDRTRHQGLPVTTVERTLLDLATTVPESALRRALAEADYRRLLNVRALEGAMTPGRRRVVALPAALAHHLPELARTRSDLEQAFLLLCKASGIQIPEVNVVVAGF